MRTLKNIVKKIESWELTIDDICEKKELPADEDQELYRISIQLFELRQMILHRIVRN